MSNVATVAFRRREPISQCAHRREADTANLTKSCKRGTAACPSDGGSSQGVIRDRGEPAESPVTSAVPPIVLQNSFRANEHKF